MTQSEAEQPLRVINAVAPIRICDNGGWTDTWFAEHGKIFNIGVYPYVEVQIAVYPRAARPDRVVLHAENYGERLVIEPMRKRGLVALLKSMKPLDEDFPEIEDPIPVPERVL